jgi:hypothetical protein
MTWYVTDKREYLAAGREIGRAFREIIGSYNAAMTAVEVRALMEDRVGAALLRLALWQLTALWGGRRAAKLAGRARVEPDDLSRAHMLAQRVFNLKHAAEVFVEESAQGYAALEALPALAR